MTHFDGRALTSASRQKEKFKRETRSPSFKFFVYHRRPLESPPNVISALLVFFITLMRNAKTGNRNEWESPDRNPNPRFTFGFELFAVRAARPKTTMRCT